MKLLCLFRHSWQEETRYYEKQLFYVHPAYLAVEHRVCTRCGKVQYLEPYYNMSWLDGSFKSILYKEGVRVDEPS